MKISEAASGVGEEMADIGMAMQRALDKTENMRARASAMDELEAAGAFDDALSLDPAATTSTASSRSSRRSRPSTATWRR